MSSKNNSSNPSRAEATFREAFERLKKGRPNLLPKGARVTQNNVAREAGLDPSALKKARFPSLIEEIQQWVTENGDEVSKSPSQSLYAHRNRNRSLREQIEALKIQRDHALALLVNADSRILELTMENKRLQAGKPKSNIASLTKKKGS